MQAVREAATLVRPPMNASSARLGNSLMNGCRSHLTLARLALGVSGAPAVSIGRLQPPSRLTSSGHCIPVLVAEINCGVKAGIDEVGQIMLHVEAAILP
jgi:hypothetical protein